jgi:hypothetical protein
MADSLVLSGVKNVKKHTGSDMLLVRPKRGGDTHNLKEWWNGGGSKQYTLCTVFNVTVNDVTVKLAITTNSLSNVRIDHDGSFGFSFYGATSISRAALFTNDFELIEHYVFPAISGGKIMTVIPPNAASKPLGLANVSMGAASITGKTIVKPSETLTYQGAVLGDAENLSYSWTVDGAATIKGVKTGPTIKVNFQKEGNVSVSLTVKSADPRLAGTNTKRASIEVSVKGS